MSTLGNITTAASGGPPAGNEGLVAVTAGVSDTATTVTAPGLGGAAGWLPWLPGTANPATPVATSPSTIAKKGWLLTSPAGAVIPLTAIGSGTWTVTLVLPAITYTGTGSVGFRAFQVSADLSSSTVITLPGADARGWVQSATFSVSAVATTTATITLSSVGAVALASTTRFLYIELAFVVATDGALGGTISPGVITVAVPALSYVITPAESLGAASDAPTRTFSGTRVPALSTPAGADAPSRTYGATRTPSNTTPAAVDTSSRSSAATRIPTESTTVATDNLSRVFAGARSPALSTPAGTDAPSRVFGATRTPPETVPATTDAVARIFHANRAPGDSTPAAADTPSRQVGFGRVPADSTPAVVDTPSRIFSANRTPHEYLAGGTPDWPLNAPTKTLAGVTRDTGGAPIGSCTVKLFRQVDDLMVATVTSDSVTGAYSFTRGGDDPNTYYVLAYAPGSPQKHGVTDRSLVPV